MTLIERARQLRAEIEALSRELADIEALTVPELFPWWREDIEYTIGDRVCYDNVLYKCLQSHTSQTQWNPKDATSLWAKVLGETILPWEQPSSTNPYMKGDKVTHNGYTWESDIDNNIWEPGVYGWSQI